MLRMFSGFGLVLWLLADSAVGGCQYDTPGATPFGIAQPVSIPPLNVDVPIGEVLFTGEFILEFPVSWGFSCTTPIVSLNQTVSYPFLGYYLYDTSIPGIGMRVYNDVGLLPLMNVRPSHQGEPGSTELRLKFELVKYGPITKGGSIPNRVIYKYEILDQPFVPIVGTLLPGTEIRLTKPTCAPRNAVIDVNLGDVSLDDLISNGGSAARNFSIDLMCSGGDGTGTTPVQVTITDQSDTSNRSTQLKLADGSSAYGAALEISNKNGLVSYGPDRDGPLNPGQWLEGRANNGNFSIPLSVRYVQTEGNPRPGTANAVASYTLTYL